VIFYKTYRLLNDSSVVDFLEISIKDVKEIVNGTTKFLSDDFSYYVTVDGKVLLADSIDDTGGYLFHSVDDIIRMRKKGIKSTTIVTMFWPEPRTFESIIGAEIARMARVLDLNGDKLDYSEASLTYIEKAMQQKQFTHQQQILELYLGILSYAGEHLIRTYEGKWHLEIEDEDRFSSWDPKIQRASGKIIDPFVDLFDGLLLQEAGKFIPIIALRP
jgi:hypothetical protein